MANPSEETPPGRAIETGTPEGGASAAAPDDSEPTEDESGPLEAEGADEIGDPDRLDPVEDEGDRTDEASGDAAEDSHEDTGEDSGEEPSAPELAETLATARLLSDGTVAPDDEPQDEHDEAEELHEEPEEHGWSLAGRVLTGLVLVLAGAGIALWAAPRIAPNLPAGLGPVKTWLLPGEALSVKRLAELEAGLDARFAAIEPGISADDAAAMGETGRAELEARLSERITALADQVAAADSAEVESRLARLETQIESLAGQVDTLGVLAGDDSLSEEAVAELSAFSAAIGGLRAGLAELADQQGALSQRIDEVEAAVARRIAEAEEEVAAITEEAEKAETTLMVRAALEALDAALASGEPFDAPLATITAAGAAVPAALSDAAPAGVATLGSLRSAFPDAAHAAIRADIGARASAGVGGRFAAFLESQVASRSLTPQEGDSTDAVLSRAEDALRRDNLAAALTELGALSEPAQAAMAGWLGRAEARVAAVVAFSELRAALAAEN